MVSVGYSYQLSVACRAGLSRPSLDEDGSSCEGGLLFSNPNARCEQSSIHPNSRCRANRGGIDSTSSLIREVEAGRGVALARTRTSRRFVCCCRGRLVPSSVVMVGRRGFQRRAFLSLSGRRCQDMLTDPIAHRPRPPSPSQDMLTDPHRPPRTNTTALYGNSNVI